MKTLKLVLVLALSAVLVIVVLQNTSTVETRFLWIRTEAPAILLVLLSSAVGFFLGLLVALLAGRERKPGRKD